MAQFTLKIKTYDPDIINAFARLRKSRKQSAYTHEALKYFLSSDQGMQVMELMARETSPPSTNPLIAKDQPRQIPPVTSVTFERQSFSSRNSAEDFCSVVLGEILK